VNSETEAAWLPEDFLKRIGGQLGEELPAFLRAMGEPPVRGIRFHPRRAAPGLPESDLLAPVPWAEDAWFLRAGSEAGVTVAHEAGAFYLQDPSAMIPAAVLAPAPGETVLDLCAAPGGKSTQAAMRMAGKGLLICNEPVEKRARILSRNLERMGVSNAVVVCAWPAALAARWPEAFDAVLADVPCSGEGMFRRDPESRREWSRERAEGCAARQAEILPSAAKLVRPGGRLVYSTCTWNPAENEEQVERFLRRHPDFEPEGFSLPGINAPEGQWTCWPHRMRGEGQFTALFRRKGTGATRLPTGPAPGALSRETRALLRRELPFLPEADGVLGSSVFRLNPIPDVSGLRVLRLGLHLAELRDRHAVPDHAFALAENAPEVPAAEADDQKALRYLAGETLEGEARGWTLIRWRGLTLGWAKGSGGTLRNHYPKGLRNALLKIGVDPEPGGKEA